MSIALAYDVAYVRFRAPDLERMHTFLLDFGMLDAVAEQPADFLYMRGEGRAPYLHVTERGDAGFAALGIWVRDRADLERLAAYDGSVVDTLDTPGGGERVQLVDPDGFIIEAIAGQRLAEPSTRHRAKTVPWNQGGEYSRVAQFRRVPKGPSHVQRLGHCVFGVSDFSRSERWYKERFGLVTSDEIRPEPDHPIGAFLRCDRGDEPCDHHTIFLVERNGVVPGFMHSAFEVADLDDLMAGHDHLKRAGYTAKWGVGRHVLGSQVFDYWLDPWGHEMEHWTDGDQLRTADGGGIASLEDLIGVQWGMQLPPRPKPVA